MALSFSDLSAWCYECNEYIHNEILLPAKNAASLFKFGQILPIFLGNDKNNDK